LFFLRLDDNLTYQNFNRKQNFFVVGFLIRKGAQYVAQNDTARPARFGRAKPAGISPRPKSAGQI
jgi:hypothetical protein